MLFAKQLRHRRKMLLFGFFLCLIVILIFSTPNQAIELIISKHTSATNPIILENAKPGTKDWQLSNPATNREIEGYASLTSVNLGDEIQLFVNTKAPTYTIEVFRMGWYGGLGGRKVIPTINRTGIKQPLPKIDNASGLIECDWQDPYTLKISDNLDKSIQWTSGIYLAKLTAATSGKQSYIIFVVRSDRQPSDILFQSSVTTFQAYNNWGAMSLYRWNSQGKQAYKVSFNRPYAASPNRAASYGVGAGEFLTNFQPKRRTSSAGWEYNMVRWLEREGYDVTYCTDIDTHENPIDTNSGKPMLLLHKAFLSVGHDEYWSWQMRQNIEAAKNQGVSLGFFSANTCYWQIRFEPSNLTKEINRTIVAYKENSALDPYSRDDDPNNDYLVTTIWRRKPVSLPEDALIGVMYETFQVNSDIIISDAAPDWFIAGTKLVENNNQTAILPFQKSKHREIHLLGLLGYEVDKMFGNAPENTILIARSPYPHGKGKKYADMTAYTTNSGSTVFATGSMQWSWGLDDYNAPQLRPHLVNRDAQMITHNILRKMINQVS
ncbi:hypothetical protein IJ00_10840 [Calothrix sp. 336/3]|nr:hypothetical protein IJ00_10840 [Calothrix sp. 336/3]